jgi:hypothetical protein
MEMAQGPLSCKSENIGLMALSTLFPNREPGSSALSFRQRNTVHLFHEGNTAEGLYETAVGLYEKDYPGVTLVIADHTGFGNWMPLAKYNDQFDRRISSFRLAASGCSSKCSLTTAILCLPS